MDRPMKPSEVRAEFAADASPLSRADYLRDLKRGNEGRILVDPLPKARTESTAPAGGPARVREKRRRPRYKCEGSVVFRTQGVDMRTWATFTDISLSGCYVELAATFPVSTYVNMALDVKGVQVEVKGIVRTSYPLVGMGIEFTEVAERERLGLEEIVLRLEGASAPERLPAPASPAAPSLLMIVDPAAALNAVVRFFQQNQSLTREQFAELMGKSHDGHQGGPR